MYTLNILVRDRIEHCFNPRNLREAFEWADQYTAAETVTAYIFLDGKLLCHVLSPLGSLEPEVK
jgi:hypothetical protein